MVSDIKIMVPVVRVMVLDIRVMARVYTLGNGA